MRPSGSTDTGPHRGGSATRSRSRVVWGELRFVVLALAVAVIAFVGALQVHNALRGGEGCYWTNGEDRLRTAAQAFATTDGPETVSLDDSNCRVGGKSIARISFPGVSAEALDARIQLAPGCGASSGDLCTVDGIDVHVLVLDEEVRIALYP